MTPSIAFVPNRVRVGCKLVTLSGSLLSSGDESPLDDIAAKDEMGSWGWSPLVSPLRDLDETRASGTYGAFFECGSPRDAGGFVSQMKWEIGHADTARRV